MGTKAECVINERKRRGASEWFFCLRSVRMNSVQWNECKKCFIRTTVDSQASP